MNVENIQAQMRKGILELCILAIIRKGEIYPSEIIDQLKTAGMHILEGTLYPLLTRLKNSNLLEYRWVESPSGPPRKYFIITTEGEQFYQVLAENWKQMDHSVQFILNQQ